MFIHTNSNVAVRKDEDVGTKTVPTAKTSPTEPESLEDIPKLIEIMLNEEGQMSADAIKRIYELCNVRNAQNRVPLVCSGKYNVLVPLAKSLLRAYPDKHQLACASLNKRSNPTKIKKVTAVVPECKVNNRTMDPGGRRHLACLALNNLSIPTENKWVMALGPESETIIGALCEVIAQDNEESYLCCVCLMNLSFLEACSTTILQHSPLAAGKNAKTLLDNEASLLRILEKLLNNFLSASKSEPSKSKAAQWACGLIKNLAKSRANATLIGKTDIPKCVTEIIRVALAHRGLRLGF
ncbi:hypothetical protein MHU86_13009 [Fragilaria crotonensis]|nr:hypothetical protein MHU86_13009 [Fragilaria crotonensis]